MNASLAAALLFCMCFVLASCVAPGIGGKYPLSEAEVRQIRQLIRWRLDIDRPIDSISSDRPGYAMMMAGFSQAHHAGESFLMVPLEKHHGQWKLAPKSQWQRITLTAD
jgi:hypothetical protein